MIELTYRSKALESLDYDDIDTILSTARKFNAEHNITGCLIYHKDHFVQVLEGPEEEVLPLYENIAKDSRHQNVEVISKGSKQNRNFATWSMAFQTLVNGPIDNVLLELFEENLITMAKFSDRSSDAVNAFWGTVSEMMMDRQPATVSGQMQREG
ncbi:MAG: BLUF domain-containing protein [Flavobacteriaceae bacterium]|nr:BLUF domain-containing protein [Flavobacteriaceae bacterium]